MGLMNWMSRQLIDIIEWVDQQKGTLVWRYPRQDNEIKNGAKLIVRPGQVAIFVFEGQIADVFAPGLYTLTTQNIPIMSSLKGWKYGFESPFKCEVYFVSTVQYLDMKWGTLKPITLRDPDFGIVRVRAFGLYAIQVDPENASTFYRELVGARGSFGSKEIETQLRGMLLSAFTAAIGQAKIPVLDIAANVDKLADVCKEKMEEQFAEYGLKLRKFVIESVSLPAEVEKAIDERASMGAIGNLGQYTQFQAAKAMREAASQPGGAAGAFMGMGAGAIMGGMMAQQAMGAMPGFAQPVAPQQPPAPVQPAAPAQPAGPSLADRLKQLKDLLAAGLIDEDTFAKKRDAILAEI